MQQRRKTATTWTASNEQLLAGELGIETDTGKWKVGDGTTLWNALPYQPSNAGVTAAITAAVNGIVNGAPGSLDALNELAAALGNDANFATTVTNALAAKANTASLAPVATAGTYTSLTGKPTLGTAAAADTTAFDAAGAAATAQAYAIQRGNHTGTQPYSTITGAPTDVVAANLLTTGQETYPRHMIQSSTVATGTGNVRLSYFTARKSETVTQIRTLGGGTAAAATPTLAKVGLYSVNTSTGALTLIGSTANTTSLHATANTAYTTALSTSVAVTTGNRYAVGIIFVTSVAAPTLAGNANSFGPETAQPPRICGQLAGQTDLPASITDASLTASVNMPYAAILP